MLLFPPAKFDQNRHVSRATDSNVSPAILVVILLMGFFLRCFAALSSETVYHPDELVQTLEQAHRLVFGYGQIPWEYRFGIRSWLSPGFMALILAVLKGLGLDQPGVYIPVIKVLLSLLSLSLVFSVYVYAKNTFSRQVALGAALMSGLWFELIYFASRPLTEMLATYTLFGALALFSARPQKRHNFLTGALLGLTMAVRLQLAPVVGVLLMVMLVQWNRRPFLRAAGGFVLVFMLAGFLDYKTWGTFLGSYVQNFKFNSTYNVSGDIFGVMPFHYYFTKLTLVSLGLFPLAALLILRSKYRVGVPLLLCATLIGSHMAIPHKEYRFVIPAVPFFLLFAALALDELARRARRAGCYLLLALFVAATVFGALRKTALPLSFPYREPIFGASVPAFEAVKLLRDDADLFGILFMGTGIWGSGGYYYLHRDVPIYLPQHAGQLGVSEDGRTADFGGVASYVSHIVVKDEEGRERLLPAGIEGYELVQMTPQIRVYRLKVRPEKTGVLDSYSTHVLQPGIDDKFEPQVAAFLGK
jgi:4-amino-4-deoxy-L-arabinose transferase-like glycosyltransferase